MTNDNYDAVVVGAGAAGIMSTKILAAKGLRVCLIEAGSILSMDARVDRAMPDASRQQVQSQSTSYTTENSSYFVDDIDHPYETEPDAPFAWFRSRGLGGRLRLWAGVSLRLNPAQFRYWPISYEDLASHYDAAESFLDVSGTEDAKLSADSGAFESRRTEIPLTPGEERVRDSLGAWSTRQLISARVAQRSVSSMLSEVLSMDGVTVRAEHVVTRIACAPGGRVSKVEGVHAETGRSFSVVADEFLLAASTVETLRLMLLSSSTYFPRGIGNQNGLVGTHFMDHTAGPSVSGLAPKQTMQRPGSAEFVPVAHMPNFITNESPAGKGLLPFSVTLFVPDRVSASSESRSWIESPAGGAVFRMWASGEVLPRSSNRVTLSETRDHLGVPVPHIHLKYSESETRMAAIQTATMEEIARSSGFLITSVSSKLLPPGSSVHELGGAWMGEEASSSVIDPFNRVWGTENLYVVDGAAFPRSAWQNPTLTIMALAHRAAEHVAMKV